MSLPLIGLSGYARSGKDEVANILVHYYGYEKMGFSDTLNDVLMALNPIVNPPWILPSADPATRMGTRYRDIVEAYGYTKAKEHPEVRALLQRMGTEAGRDILGENIWVDALFDRIGRSNRPVAITNCRFPNEEYAVREAGGIIIQVTRPGIGPVNDHISDALLVEPDFYIHNGGTLEDLEQLVVDFMDDFISKKDMRRWRNYALDMAA